MTFFLGIDWSAQKHDAVCRNEAGAVLWHLTIPHSSEGFLKLDTQVRQSGVTPAAVLVGIETAHNLLLDFLWAHEYTQVYVIAPSVVKSCRGRFGASGARSDQSDAHLLADLVRTDRARLQLWQPDTRLTRQLRAKVSAYHFLTQHSVRFSNRLHALLVRYYPAALQVFSDITTQIALAFLQAYPTPAVAQALTLAEFKQFVSQHRYPKPALLPHCFARLQAPQPQPSADTVSLYQSEVVMLAQVLLEAVRTKQRTLAEIQTLFAQHPDAALFASLPGAGDLLAPALLVQFGDDRRRFPSAASVQALAGTCPYTAASGKFKTIGFRHGCNHEFRQVAQQFARSSLTQSAWAVAYYEQVRPHCRSDSHAVRCLANRWLAILWKMWQTQQVYNESYHVQQRAAHSQPRGG
jgi:transposase